MRREGREGDRRGKRTAEDNMSTEKRKERQKRGGERMWER
jgi:hypothetical protein